jgi:hypothetical protein
MIRSLLLLTLFWACASPSSEKKDQTVQNTEQIWQVRVFQNQDSSFGYEILQNHNTLIHQPTIPAVSGNRGFSSFTKAQQTGNFVAKKLEMGLMPPSLSVEELDSLGVLD